ncbi:LEA type 2 family protein [Methanotorris igneus]|uniref:LEA type 2 family protein n=1 Tax=Methanotorris igneus TaxID=2189 RepID=UPI001FDF42DF|nr:LEA type 2 family protein [Methanotorris igneus]
MGKVLLMVFSLVIVSVINCGCVNGKLKEPTFSVDSLDFKGVNYDTTNLNVKLIIDNPNPIGVHVNKIVFDIYYIDNNGNPKYLGHGEKANIDIRSGKTTIDIPIALSNKELIKALENSKDNKITLEIDGSANVDLKITSIDVPFKTKQTVQLPENVVSYLETAKKMGIGFSIEDFKKPNVTVDDVEFEGISEDFKNTKLNVRLIVENPNPIDINLKDIAVHAYYYDKDGKHYFGSAKLHNTATIKGGISTPIYVDVNISNEDVVNAILSNKDSKKITVKIEGSIDIEGIKKYGISELKIPFENTKEIPITDNMIKMAETAKNKLGIGFTIKDFKKPNVTVDDVEFEGTDLENLYLNVKLIVDNPNPIDIDISKIKYYVYADNGEKFILSEKLLGEGEGENIHIYKATSTPIDTHVKLQNKKVIINLIRLAKNDKITLLIKGVAYIDEIKKFNIPPMNIPFEEKKNVSINELKEKFGIENNENKDSENNKINNVVINRIGENQQEEQPIQKPELKQLYITCYPNEIKVGDRVTIQVVDENGNPVEGATVIIDGTIRRTTDNNGVVYHTFKIGGTHTIKVEKDGCIKEISINVERLIEQVDIKNRVDNIINRVR